MLKRTLGAAVAVAVAFAIVSCANNQSQGDASQAAAQEQTSSQATAEMSVDDLLASADTHVGKEVTFRGICTHTCSHGATKIFLMGSDDTKTIRVEAGALGSFDTRCVNNLVSVTGVVSEQRIDEAYLQRWEAQVKDPTGEKQGKERKGSCSTEKKVRGENGNSQEERIADFRKRIAERKAKEGKDYLSFYYVTAISYEIQ